MLIRREKGGLRQGGKTIMAFIKSGRSRLLIGCILGIGLALLFVRSSAYVWAQEPGGRPVSLDVILLIDNSWSMSHGNPLTGAPPSDPEELRVRAAKFLVDYLRANAEALGANYRVGVVSFGGEVSDVIPLRLLQDDTVREGIHAEEIRRTDFRGPLQFALDQFEARSFGTGNKMAVILFTDGCPNPAMPMTDQDYFEDLASLVGELREGEVSLFILGIGDAQGDRDNWMRLIPREYYIPITSTTELADVYHRIVADLIGVAVFKEETLPAGQEVSIEVEPYLEHVIFSFMKSDPAIRIRLTSPSGVVLTPTIGGTAEVHHAIYGVTNPDAGDWKALWQGGGEVRYWVDKQYPLIRVEPMKSPSLVGQPITITASLVRNNVTVVDPGLHLEAEIALPDGDVVTQSLSPVGGGRHTGSYEDVKMKGTYTVTGRAFLNSQPLIARALRVTVDVFPLPAMPTPTPSLTPSPSATPAAPEQATPTLTPTVRLPWEGLVPPRVEPFLWLVPLGVGLLVGWVLWNLVPRLTGRETKDVREIGDSLRSEKDPAERRKLFQRVNLWAIKLERMLKEFKEIKEDIQKATEQEWRDRGWKGVLDLWSVGELEIASLLQELLAGFIIENHQESEALSTILELVNAGRFDKGKEFRSRFLKTLSEIFGDASEEARREEGRDFSYRIYDEYAQLLRYVANDDAERILATLLNIPDVLDKYAQVEDLSFREDLYYLCYFLVVLDPERLSDGREIRFYPEAEEGLRQGSRYKDLPDFLAPVKGLRITTPDARETLSRVQDSISQSKIPQFEKTMITILLRELKKVPVASASETSV